jgi:hypothetical protein
MALREHACTIAVCETQEPRESRDAEPAGVTGVHQHERLKNAAETIANTNKVPHKDGDKFVQNLSLAVCR